MSTITNKQLYSEMENVRRELKQLRETVTQYQVAQTTHPYIVKIEGYQGGEPMVRSAHVTVRTIVEQIRLGTTPEQLVKGYPPLTLAEIYDALSYYYDHTSEIESIIEENRQALARGVGFAAQRTQQARKTNPVGQSEK
jgi:uncharacterized protein (DUF433 family)